MTIFADFFASCISSEPRALAVLRMLPVLQRLADAYGF